MADPNSNAIDSNQVVSDTAEQKKSKLWDLLALAKEVSNDVEGFQNYERSMQAHRQTENELEAKNKEVEKLRELNIRLARECQQLGSTNDEKCDKLFAEFQRRFKMLEKADKVTIDAANERAVQAEARMKAMKVLQEERLAEIDALKSRLVSVEEHIVEQDRKLKDGEAMKETLRTRVETHGQEMRLVTGSLQQAHRDLGYNVLASFDDKEKGLLVRDLAALSKKSHAMVLQYFSDLDGAKDSGSEIVDLKARFPKIPLSTASTRPAAQMRCAVAEAVIAEVLINQIFIPFYLPNSYATASSRMLDYFSRDENQLTIYRAQLLKSLSDKEEAAHIMEDIVRKASNEVRTTLHPLVMAHKQAGFYNAVPGFFREAATLWKSVQCARFPFTAEAPSMDADPLPNKHDDYDKSNGYNRPKKSPVEKSIAAVLFPQVVGDDDWVIPGLVLWSDQTAVLAAMKEMPPTPVNGHFTKMVVRRRMSATSSDSASRRE